MPRALRRAWRACRRLAAGTVYAILAPGALVGDATAWLTRRRGAAAAEWAATAGLAMAACAWLLAACWMMATARHIVHKLHRPAFLPEGGLELTIVIDYDPGSLLWAMARCIALLSALAAVALHWATSFALEFWAMHPFTSTLAGGLGTLMLYWD